MLVSWLDTVCITGSNTLPEIVSSLIILSSWSSSKSAFKVPLIGKTCSRTAKSSKFFYSVTVPVYLLRSLGIRITFWGSYVCDTRWGPRIFLGDLVIIKEGASFSKLSFCKAAQDFDSREREVSMFWSLLCFVATIFLMWFRNTSLLLRLYRLF